LDQLAAGFLRAPGGADDPADQARRYDLLGGNGAADSWGAAGHDATDSRRVDVGEPPVLHPALLYEPRGLDEERIGAVQLSEPGVEPVPVTEQATHALAVPSPLTTGPHRGTFIQ